MSFLNDYLSENLNNEEFKKEWKDSELEYIIARNIIRRRNALGLTQQDLATRMKTRQSVISRLESGHQNVTIKSLKQVANILKTSVPSLMSDNEADSSKLENRKYKLVRN